MGASSSFYYIKWNKFSLLFFSQFTKIRFCFLIFTSFSHRVSSTTDPLCSDFLGKFLSIFHHLSVWVRKHEWKLWKGAFESFHDSYVRDFTNTLERFSRRGKATFLLALYFVGRKPVERFLLLRLVEMCVGWRGIIHNKMLLFLFLMLHISSFFFCLSSFPFSKSQWCKLEHHILCFFSSSIFLFAMLCI